MTTLVQPPPVVPIGIPQLHFGDTLHSWDVDKGKYVHTAIYFGNDEVAHIRLGGQAVESVRVLGQPNHVVGVHRPYRGVWTDERKKGLVIFVNGTTKSTYNKDGAQRLNSSWDAHVAQLHAALHEWAKSNSVNVKPIRSSYFCSEFVVACFIATGVMKGGAALLYEPSVYSPNRVANDFAFGEPIGFVDFQ